MFKAQGYAAQSATTPLDAFAFERREPLDHDVQIHILYCGVCHTDLHFAKNEWKNTIYPVVPGHEIVGKVVKVGKGVKGFKVGDLAAVGCMVDSCRTCPNCKEHLEQYCDVGSTFTYNSPDKHTGQNTYGGYSTSIVVDENYVLRIPSAFKEADLPGVAPLLCAGITTYSPLRHWNIQKGKKVGVVGLGGLGHMAVKLAHAMGAHVVLFTSSPQKVADGKRLGADEVVVTKSNEALKPHNANFDLILDTVTVSHSLDPYIELLKRDGTLCMLGVAPDPHPSPNIAPFIFKRRSLAGSVIGGIKETQRMLDFCADHHILSDVEVIKMSYINKAYERMVKSDVKYRFVIDIANSLKT
jgi:uncharacterized zinc-type alcohol dehydrogenase-like protein